MTPALAPIAWAQMRSTRRVISASRPTGEGHQQDAARIGAVDDQMGDAMGERVGLAGSRARDDQQRASRRAVLLADAVFDCPSLFGIEFFQIGQGRRLRIGGWSRRSH